LKGKPSKKPPLGRQQGFTCWLLHADFLLGLLFDPEDGDAIFLRNVGLVSLDYKAIYLRRENSSHPPL
jgi:hypothetical protein